MDKYRRSRKTVPKRCQTNTNKLHNGSTKVPKQFRASSISLEKVPKQFRNSSKRFPNKFRTSSEQIHTSSEISTNKFRNSSEQVPKQLRNNFQTSSEQVPKQFQTSSETVQNMFRNIPQTIIISPGQNTWQHQNPDPCFLLLKPLEFQHHASVAACDSSCVCAHFPYPGDGIDTVFYGESVFAYDWT